MLTAKVLDPRYHYRPLQHTARETAWLIELVARCHPTRKEWPRAYWFAFPTYVIQHPRHLALIGYSAVSVQGALMQGIDMGVDPDFRRRGLGKILMFSRLRLCRQLGMVTTIVGQTQGENAPMVHLFDQAGFEQMNVVEGYYTDLEGGPRDAVIFAGNADTWKET
jgi:ribosomal protein S18 acetylase RimI-like enzyme